MNQNDILTHVRELLEEASVCQPQPAAAKKLNHLKEVFQTFQEKNIDYKSVIDRLTDGVLITDAAGKVLYINPAFTKNTNIRPEEIEGYDIAGLKGEDKLYTGGVVQEILKTPKNAFRLCTTYRTDPPMRGYVTGSPIFDENENLHLVVSIHRTLISLNNLQSDFRVFLNELQQMHPLSAPAADDASDSRMVGGDGSLSGIRNLIRQIAATDATVLITGESGTGKEVIADEIFRLSARNQQPFIKLNCASIPAQLLESELFGYEKGAFSGADPHGKKGLFEAANHGTLMLDEIGDMPMDLQVKLLRAIQQQEIVRIGGSRAIKLDIRFIALTNADLREKIEEGTFRQDLFYRLNVIPIHVPPLRERLADLPELCESFIARFSKKYHCEFHFAPRQYQIMKNYRWPGNIRELENIVEYVVICSAGEGEIDDSILAGLLHLSPDSADSLPLSLDFYFEVEQYEKQLIEDALASSGSLRKAAKKLGLNPSTVSRKIKQYGILPPT